MRDMAHSWIIKGLMLFLIVSFGIWGIGDMFRGNSLRKAVAEVGNTTITVQQLNQLFGRQLIEAKQKINPDLTEEQARQMGLLDRALDQEIVRRLVDLDLARRGIEVGPDEVLKLLAEEPQFRKDDGTFNKALFQQILERQRMSEKAFIAEGQQDIARQMLLSFLEGGAFPSQMQADSLYKARAQKRVLEIVSIDASKMGNLPVADEATLRDYYDKNQPLFAVPEYRAVTIATLEPDSMGKEASITDEQVKKAYDERTDQFMQPERRDLLQVVVQDEAKAKKIADEAKATGNLSETAKKAKESAVPLEQVDEKYIVPEVSAAAFALALNGVSNPVKTQMGWHVLQVKKIEPSGIPSFDKVKEGLREELKQEQAVEGLTRIVNQLDDQLAAGHALEDIADSLRLRLVKIPAVSAQGLTPEGKEPTEMPNRDAVLSLAFDQNAGETSPVSDNGDGGYFVVRTDDVTPSGARPFEAAKAQVEKAWKQSERLKKAQAKADAIEKALKDGAKYSSFDKDEGVSSRLSKPVSLLGDEDESVSASLMAKAFLLKKGETAEETKAGTITLIRLASVENVDSTKPDSRKSVIVEELKGLETDELFQQYLLYLRTIFPVKKNEAVLAQMRSRGS